ncbi:D-aminoacyl-tRNA deacylase, partial [Staphylococcus capitis]|uniref:D-aminoacyl-tRNA deacylase n=1 Tax=Staphylococcus capitis TaxID=29388 RepID=UPI0016424140
LKRANPPRFSNSKTPQQPKQLYQTFNHQLQSYPLTLKTPQFRTHINLQINNHPPLTIIYQSHDAKILSTKYILP